MLYRQALQEALAAEFAQAWSPSPPILYRYVEKKWASQISDAHTLMASSISEHAHHSDMLEFQLGWGLIRTTAKAIGEQAAGDETLRELCRRIAEDRNPFDKDYNVYALCLTSQRDAEHMWEHFGDDAGVRFGFRAKELLEGIQRAEFSKKGSIDAAVSSRPHSVQLLQVHYDADDLITAVEDMIRKVVMPGVLQRIEESPNLDPLVAANSPFYELRNIFVPMALSFKRAKFRNEKEWRIIATTSRELASPQLPRLPLKCADKDGLPVALPIVDVKDRSVLVSA